MPKPIVFYDSVLPHSNVVVGKSANLLGVINHPLGLEGSWVITSRVVEVGPQDGSGNYAFIETENTCYKPAFSHG